MGENKITPEVIDPVELVKRVHKRLVALIQSSLDNNDIGKGRGLYQADDILIEELQAMLAEAEGKILKGGDLVTIK